MANDAKMGLLAGLASVLMIAVVYYQKTPSSANPTGTPGATRSPPRPASVGDPVLFPPPQVDGPKDVLLRQ